MSDRIGEDALLDVGCCLDRFEVDSIQCFSWKSHTFLANKSHILPMRLLGKAEIDGSFTLVSARDPSRGKVSFDGTPQEALQRALAAIKDSDLEYLTLFDPTRDPISAEEVDQIAAVAATVKVAKLSVYARLTHLPPPALHRLMFGFASIKELTLYRFNGNQLADEHLRECARRQIYDLRLVTEAADARPVAFSDEALLDFLFASEHGMPEREVTLSAFNASPQFVQKLVSRANLATTIAHVDLIVHQLPLGGQQLGGMHLTPVRGIAEHSEWLENGAHLMLEFRREPVPPRRARLLDEEEEPEDQFHFSFWK